MSFSKRIFLLCLILTLLAFPFASVTAQEPAPGSKEDNACNEGGSMAGKCDTAWEWECGYYLARWEAAGGWNTPNNRLNDFCVSLLPPPPAPVASVDVPETFCILHNGGYGLFCLTDNVGLDDIFNDGTIDGQYLHLPPGSSCPAPFTDGIFTVATYIQEVEGWLNSLGFADNFVVCRNLPPF